MYSNEKGEIKCIFPTRSVKGVFGHPIEFVWLHSSSCRIWKKIQTKWWSILILIKNLKKLQMISRDNSRSCSSDCILAKELYIQIAHKTHCIASSCLNFKQPSSGDNAKQNTTKSFELHDKSKHTQTLLKSLTTKILWLLSKQPSWAPNTKQKHNEAIRTWLQVQTHPNCIKILNY